MNNVSKVLVSALVTGLFAGSTALAQDAATTTQQTNQKTTTTQQHHSKHKKDKHSCNAKKAKKDGCSGKNGCKGKNKAKTGQGASTTGQADKE